MVDIDGFTRRTEQHGGRTHDVYQAGSGPAVIVIHEIPGLHPGVIAFARKVIDAGFTVYLPSLVGTPGKDVSMPYNIGSMARACVARDFATFATGKTSPIVAWLRALARDAHAACGGPGVGAIGMCLTGGFALAMMVDDTMVAPVLSQPSMPFPISASRRRDVGVSDDDLVKIRARCAAGTPVMGLRFTGDGAVPGERFARLREELGDRFIAIEIDSSAGNPYGIPTNAHSVLTHHLVDQPGHPTRVALERVIAFFRDRLAVA